MTDYHCHLLPGIDDGPAAVEESVSMAAALARCGFSHVICTPHRIRGLYEPTPEAVRDATENLSHRLERDGVALRVSAGAEYSVDEYLLADLDDPLHLFDDVILAEIPPRSDPRMVKEVLFQVVAKKGLRPMIAHPERCPLLECGAATESRFFPFFRRQRRPASAESLLEYLVQIGCLFQGNYGSFSGYYGAAVRSKAEAFRARGLYRCMGSDGHCEEQVRQVFPEGARC